jgi:hypothetical protein
MSDWWRAVDDELSRRADAAPGAASGTRPDAAPDPWASRLTGTDTRLTDEQQRFLEQLVGQATPFLEPGDLRTGDSASAP